MTVIGIGGARLLKRRDRRVLLAELDSDLAEREPGGGKIRRKLGRLHEKIGGGDPLITVFMPNGPNPTTGFIVFMPASEVIPLDLAVEDAAKLIVSAGLVGPDQQQEELRKLARAKAGKPVPEEEPVV